MWLSNDCMVIHNHVPYGLPDLLNFLCQHHSCILTTGFALCSTHIIIWILIKSATLSLCHWWIALHKEPSQQSPCSKLTYSACTQKNKTAHMPYDQLHSAHAFSSKGSCFSGWKVPSCFWLAFPWLPDKRGYWTTSGCLVSVHIQCQSLTGI